MPLISIQNVHVTYPPKKVLCGIDLDIHAGEFISVVGQTGCGKSTLLRLILGAETPTSGRILIDGEERSHPDRDRGYVPQKYSLFPDKTVVENMIFGLELAEFGLFNRFTPRFFRRRKEFEAEAHDYLRAMGLCDADGRKYPDELSGGMQQRVAIAQALITKPKILLMDEAFSALDPGTRREMQRLIRRVWRDLNTTILFVTHNTHEAVFLGTRVVLLAKNEAAGGAQVAMDLQVPNHETPEEISTVVREIEGYAEVPVLT
jgi:NitT/TauT family transport system ATP-binding protein